VSVATNYALNGPDFETRQKQEFFSYSKHSITVLGSTQPHVQWVFSGTCPGVKRPGVNLKIHLH
jgi:hypothetical protein